MARARCSELVILAGIGTAALTLLPASVCALSIQLDYRFDSTGFFDSPERRAVLEAAAADVTGRFGDPLHALIPSGADGWTARFSDPSSGLAAGLDDLVIPQDTLLVFAGAQDLGPNGLGRAGPGTVSATGSLQWYDALRYRGQVGADESPATDFGPWGGSVSFDLDVDWHSSLGLDGMGSEQFDLYSVSLHEFAHVLGFGLSDSWRDQISIGRFTGEASTTSFGERVRLSPELEHWRDGTLSAIAGLPQEALLTAFLPSGERRSLTALDLAGLVDVGWTLVPEPGTGSLVGLGLFMLAGRRRPRLRALGAR